MEILLIDRAEILKYYDIGKNIDEHRITTHIRRAQQENVKAILGEYLYFDVLNNPDTAANSKLINGGTYDPKNKGLNGTGRIPCDQPIECDDLIVCSTQGSIYYSGLKALLCSFSYAALEKNNDTFVGRGGNKNKDILESTKQPQNVTNAREVEATSDGVRLQAELIRFLNDRQSDYPLYKVPTDYVEQPQKSGFRITRT